MPLPWPQLVPCEHKYSNIPNSDHFPSLGHRPPFTSTSSISLINRYRIRTHMYRGNLTKEYHSTESTLLTSGNPLRFPISLVAQQNKFIPQTQDTHRPCKCCTAGLRMMGKCLSFDTSRLPHHLVIRQGVPCIICFRPINLLIFDFLENLR